MGLSDDDVIVTSVRDLSNAQLVAEIGRRLGVTEDTRQ